LIGSAEHCVEEAVMATSRRTASGTISDEAQEVPAAGEDTVAAGREGGRSLGRIVSAPVTVAREVVDDLGAAARRPEAVLYWGGLAAMTALGVIELPVAAAVGVGVAVAGGFRRAQR
jgi:hypothetical protein